MPQDRHIAIELIEEAVTAGARYVKACAVLEVDVRTLQRWKKTLADQAWQIAQHGFRMTLTYKIELYESFHHFAQAF